MKNKKQEKAQSVLHSWFICFSPIVGFTAKHNAANARGFAQSEKNKIISRQNHPDNTTTKDTKFH